MRDLVSTIDSIRHRFDFFIGYRASTIQLFRYALVGIISNTAGYFMYLIFTFLGSSPKLTMTCLYGFGAIIGFIGNRNLTFADNGNVIGSSVRYMVAHLFGYLINFIILFIFVDKFGYAHQLVQAVAILIVACFIFFALKFFVFRDLSVPSLERL